MPSLQNKHIQHIMELLEAGETLPAHYKPLLFPERPLIDDGDLTVETPGSDEALILVVDDNSDNRSLLADLLMFQGHESHMANNGAVAYEMLQETNYDLVLLDIMMPEMTGYELLEHMKHDDTLRHIPVIMISAISDMDSVIRCIKQGAEDYIPKPFKPTLLKARVEALLEKKRLRDKEQAFTERLRIERAKSERLLLNILPETIADRLKQDDSTIADYFTNATVLFADIVGFTRISADIPAKELVNLLNDIFSAFDHLAEQHRLEKIKTIGDAYMVVGGLPEPRDDHAHAVAEMAIDMQGAIGNFVDLKGDPIQLRIGINSGPVVAGVIGTKKFIYDLWGDSVNIASRMEQLAPTGSIQVTEATYQQLHNDYGFEPRGTVDVKGRGEMQTYLLTDRNA